MVEVKFKPGDVGSVLAGSVTSMGKFPSGTTDPPSPTNGDLFYNSTENKFKRYSVDAWITIDMVDSLDRITNGLLTDDKINEDAGIAQSKVSLAITNDEVAENAAINVSKVADAVAGTGTSGDKKIVKLGWDSSTGEIIVDHEA
jgi:hypothetical protein